MKGLTAVELWNKTKETLSKYGDSFIEEKYQQGADEFAQSWVKDLESRVVEQIGTIRPQILLAISGSQKLNFSETENLAKVYNELGSYKDNPFGKSEVIKILAERDKEFKENNFYSEVMMAPTKEAAIELVREKYKSRKLPQEYIRRVESKIRDETKGLLGAELKELSKERAKWQAGFVYIFKDPEITSADTYFVFEFFIQKLQDLPKEFSNFKYEQMGICDNPGKVSPEDERHSYNTYGRLENTPLSKFDIAKLSSFIEDLGLLLRGIESRLGYGRLLDADITLKKVNDYKPLPEGVHNLIALKSNMVPYISFSSDNQRLTASKLDGQYVARHFICISSSDRVEGHLIIPKGSYNAIEKKLTAT